MGNAIKNDSFSNFEVDFILTCKVMRLKGPMPSVLVFHFTM